MNVERTDDGWEIRNDDDQLITVSQSWPPKDSDVVEDLLNEAEVSKPVKSMLRILHGIESVTDSREE